MTFDSPLRYPGGKASLSKLLSRTIEINGLSGCSYYEPFAGGAGAALNLLKAGTVDTIHLNDFDLGIVSFWRSVLYETKRFADAILSIPLNIDEWERQLQVRQQADPDSPFDLGFATFYLNRCNRSGIILGAAPIGGYSQSARWRMDARFYRETLAQRVLAIGDYRERVHVSHMDALAFLTANLPALREQNSFLHLFRPAVLFQGATPVHDVYNDQDHIDFGFIYTGNRQTSMGISYDDADFIRELYTSCRLSSLSLNYSLQTKRKAHELFILPPEMLHPDEKTTSVP